MQRGASMPARTNAPRLNRHTRSACAILALAAACSPGEGARSSSARAGQAGTNYLVSVARPTGGVISSGADGKINCGTAAAATKCGPVSYAWNEVATLTATADDGFMFGTWAGECTGRPKVEGEYACVLDTSRYGADKYVVAVFGEPGRTQHANFSDPAVHGPEFLNAVAKRPDSFECDHCHGSTYGGLGIALSCNGCHRGAGWTNWQTNCSFCHGTRAKSYDFPGNPRLAAPPDTTAQRLGGPADPSRSGAHQAHVTGISQSGIAYSAPMACTACHPAVSDLSHISGADGRATVTLASGGYDAESGTCTSRCHGPNPSPAWSSGPITCDACHGLPSASHPASLAHVGCARCHPTTIDSAGTLLAAGGKHVNGTLDVLARWDNCIGCHPSTGPVGPTVVSKHNPPFTGVAPPADNLLCSACHESSHLNGRPMSTDARCVSCHTGQGETVGSSTPPRLVGWTDAVNGDFHGARASTGLGGGTLAPPYVRGQPALPCRSCHASHTSENPFLIAAVVNGVTIPAGSFDRAGVGAQVLCEACHKNPAARHANCAACHGGDPAPAGRPCFTCHGHEGLVQIVVPTGGAGGNWDVHYDGSGCEHCHDQVYGPLSRFTPCWSEPPVLTPAGASIRFENVAATYATVLWDSARPTSTWLEWGTAGKNGNVSGDGALSVSHSVALTGLAPATTYTFTVRMVDACRNVTEIPGTFTTMSADYIAPPAGLTTRAYWDSRTREFWWSPVTGATRYELQVAANPGFEPLSAPTLSTTRAGTSSFPNTVTLATRTESSCATGLYYWRVRTTNAAGASSPWSTTLTFPRCP